MQQQNRQDMNGSTTAAASSHLPTSLPSLNQQQHQQPGQQSNYYVSRQYLRNLPFMAQSNGFVIATNPPPNHYGSRRGHPMAASMGANLGAGQHLPPLSNRNNQNAASIAVAGGAAGAMQNTGAATNAAVSQSEAWSKPRLITIVRATDRPRKKITILLNRKVIHLNIHSKIWTRYFFF